MNLLEMITQTREIINETDSSNSHVTNSQLTTYLNEATRVILSTIRSLPRELYSTTAAETITLEDTTLAADHAFLEDTNSKYYPLSLIDFDLFCKLFPNWLSDDTNKPAYLVRETMFNYRLYPAPDSNYLGKTLKIYLRKFPTEMSTDTDEPDLPLNMHDLYPHYAAYRAFPKLNQYDKSSAEYSIFNNMLRTYHSVSTKTRGNNASFKFI